MFQLPVLPELMFLRDDMHELGDLFVGNTFGVKRQGTFTPKDIEAIKYTFGSYGWHWQHFIVFVNEVGY